MHSPEYKSYIALKNLRITMMPAEIWNIEMCVDSGAESSSASAKGLLNGEFDEEG